jgi:hypothetical protein
MYSEDDIERMWSFLEKLTRENLILPDPEYNAVFIIRNTNLKFDMYYSRHGGIFILEHSERYNLGEYVSLACAVDRLPKDVLVHVMFNIDLFNEHGII